MSTPLSEERTGSPRFLTNPLDNMPWTNPPPRWSIRHLTCNDGIVAAFSDLKHLGSLHNNKPFSRLNTFTLSHYGLRSPCLRFTHTISRINAKLGSDGRLTLSGWLLNQLDSPSFAWRTKNLLLVVVSIGNGVLCVKKIMTTKCMVQHQ